MRIASLGSGSRGNGTLIEDADTCILVDAGFTLKETERRLRKLNRLPTDLSAVLVTHEHGDHINGVGTFARKYRIPVYLTPGTYNPRKIGTVPFLEQFNCHRSFALGSFHIEPVPVPHDAQEPCQYVIASKGTRVGLLTDIGHITPHVQKQYQSCDALLLECNHDVQMLARGPYPAALKNRVGGSHGHLNNEQAAELVRGLDHGRLRHLVLSHISEKNNTAALAVGAMQSVLPDWPGELHVASQDEGVYWVDLDS
ncbi:MAG: MBL fold metallo-hydrolase [Pseudomonadales bacterium]